MSIVENISAQLGNHVNISDTAMCGSEVLKNTALQSLLTFVYIYIYCGKNHQFSGTTLSLHKVHRSIHIHSS